MLTKFYLAVTGNAQTLSNSLSQINKIQQAWDQTWSSTFKSGFADGSSPYFFMTYIATFVATLASIFWIMRWAQELSAGDYWGKHLPHMLLVLVVGYYLINSSQLGSLLYGLHALGRSWETGILFAEISGVKIAEALNDQLATSQAKDEIQQAFGRCDAMNAPSVAIPSPTRPTGAAEVALTPAQRQVYDKLECYEQAAEVAEQVKQKYEQAYCWGQCAGLARFFANLKRANQTWLSDIKSQISQGKAPNFSDVAFNPLANVVLTSTNNQIVKWLLYAIQKAFVHLMEFGQWAAALGAPMALAMSLIPARNTNSIVSWLIIFFNISMSKIYYILILGVYASVIATAEAQTTEELTFALILGLFAPVVAIGLATGGALVMLRAVASTGAGVASAALSIGASTAVSFIGIARRLVLKR